jgi:hypothetical protein
MPPLYVSFYTPGYAEEAAALRETLDRFGLPHEIRAMNSMGNWTHNCAMKSAFVCDMLHQRLRPVVWVDADARVVRYPDLFNSLDCDFAAHWRWDAELLSGTLYFAATDTAANLAKAWAERCIANPQRWDQRTLQETVASIEGLRDARLPASYCSIFDAPDMQDEPAVILHTQASRRLKADA